MCAQRPSTACVISLCLLMNAASVGQLPPSVVVAVPHHASSGELPLGNSGWATARPGVITDTDLHRASIAGGHLRYRGAAAPSGTIPLLHRPVPEAAAWRVRFRFRAEMVGSDSASLHVSLTTEGPLESTVSPIAPGLRTTASGHFALADSAGVVTPCFLALVSGKWNWAELQDDGTLLELRVWDDALPRPSLPLITSGSAGPRNHVVFSPREQKAYDVSIDDFSWTEILEDGDQLHVSQDFATRAPVHPLPGSGHDLALTVSSGGLAPVLPGHLFVAPGSTVQIHIESPTGTHHGASALFATAPISPQAPLLNSPVPGAHLPLVNSTSSLQPVQILSAPTLLAPGGTGATLFLPATMTGTRLRLQGFACAADGSLVACSEGLELVVSTGGATVFN